ncbi:MAG: YifB family Mg chelatase-like AAA ATPase [Acidimicrobiia bacterium]|nr:YifB family Mg chelatase-like AAA ATPase [Acidimicrobiia bacterium]NNC76099.1 YifB family Mg chelatase-like AAA ATPase [Acidimicrobiia bacterium]
MFASVTSVVLVGVEPVPLRVEVHAGGGSKTILQIVGLPDTAVREAKQRVTSALIASGLGPPRGYVVVNLSPADVPKAGSAYDLPIALGLLAAFRRITASTHSVVALGELALDGTIRSARGGLGAALIARDQAESTLLLPRHSVHEARLVPGVEPVGVASLAEAVAVLEGDHTPDPVEAPVSARIPPPDFSAIRGQKDVRRGLEIAAAGGHHVLMSGSPGAGKTLMASCLPGILPELEGEEALETALAWAAGGRQRPDPARPPFRAPHHSATMAALIGGGSGIPVPGEVTMAHNGVLFLDELGEFPPTILDALRQPLESGAVTVARKGASVRFPARFQLIAATNPCPCGFYEDRLVGCECTPAIKARYRRRFSGPLLDRIDLRLGVDRVDVEDLDGPPGEPSASMSARVLAARKRQADRGSLNASLGRDELAGLPSASEVSGILRTKSAGARLSARGWLRILRVARTIADLDENDVVVADHVEEALSLRERPDE